MREFVQRRLAFAMIGLAAVLSGRAVAQDDSARDGASASPAEEPEEITVRGRKSVTQYRLEMEEAREEIIELFNELNSGDDNDVTCRQESQTGSRTRQRVCRSGSANRADASAAREFLNSLFVSSGSFLTNTPLGGAPPPAGGPQVNAAVGTGKAQGDAVTGGASAQDSLQTEMQRLLGENRELYRAVVKYVELEDEYNKARGATTAPAKQEVNVSIEVPPPALVSAQCGATATTEYRQLNTVARINSALSISDCAAASGAFTIALRIRPDSGEDKTLEFSETWQRSDDQDVKFASDYPIGENVFLVSARLRGLTCTCGDSATPGQPLAEN